MTENHNQDCIEDYLNDSYEEENENRDNEQYDDYYDVVIPELVVSILENRNGEAAGLIEILKDQFGENYWEIVFERTQKYNSEEEALEITKYLIQYEKPNKKVRQTTTSLRNRH
ncbi:Hypothetical_protein [Hexamita inflata]|uniref:Hypothetical_protein n=1 Tax=Hexamita inflata TaxID=28002 RepID=A0AA86PIS4_9EUKA|nr:Hypothetical protein HINF_LOCUS25643 [Hexamita inflata]